MGLQPKDIHGRKRRRSFCKLKNSFSLSRSTCDPLTETPCVNMSMSWSDIAKHSSHLGDSQVIQSVVNFFPVKRHEATKGKAGSSKMSQRKRFDKWNHLTNMSFQASLESIDLHVCYMTRIKNQSEINAPARWCSVLCVRSVSGSW